MVQYFREDAVKLNHYSRITRPASQGQHALTSSKAGGPNVILYLPSGPIFGQRDAHPISDAGHCHQSQDIEDEISKQLMPQHVLASRADATVVTVEYRLGNMDANRATSSSKSPSTSLLGSSPTVELEQSYYQYPTPIHDTIAGFDWVQNNLQPANLGVFGSHIGGSLALMLALTEAQSVKAVAAADPICDWPGLDDYCIRDTGTLEGARKGSKKKSSRTVAPPDLIPLLEARKQLFSSFERCFDAFASPILFLRSAGRDVPKLFPQYLKGPDYPVPVLQETRSATLGEQHAVTDSPVWDQDSYPSDEDSPGQNDPPARRRKALSRWPPYGLDYGSSGNSWSRPGHGVRRLEVTLPWVRIYSGAKIPSQLTLEEMSQSATKGKPIETTLTVLGQQSEEMVSVLRRACFFGREKGYGERIVTLAHTDSDAGQEAAHWLGDVFDGSLKDD